MQSWKPGLEPGFRPYGRKDLAAVDLQTTVKRLQPLRLQTAPA
jgi:hypothetical protein